MIEAEFDYFKICNDEFVKRLTEAGINTEVILYEGLDHGFLTGSVHCPRRKTVSGRSPKE